MGNQNVKENSEIFRKNVAKTKKGDECLINFGEKTLLKLEKTIFETYPFLSTDTEDSACLVDLRLPDQPLIYVNDQFSKLTLYPKEEIIGRNCRFLQGKFTNRKTVKRIQEAISAGEALDVELLNYRKDGLPFFNNFLLLPVWVKLSMRDRGKPPTHYIAVQKDVTLVKPQLAVPAKWKVEEVAVFCESMRLSTFAAFAFSIEMTGESFLKLNANQLTLAGVPPQEQAKVLELVSMLAKDPEATAKFLNQVRFSNKSNFIRGRSTSNQFTQNQRTTDDWSAGSSLGQASGKKMKTGYQHPRVNTMTFDDYECSEFSTSDDEKTEKGEKKGKEKAEGDPEEGELQEGEGGEGGEGEEEGAKNEGEEEEGKSSEDEPDTGVLEQKYEVLNPADMLNNPAGGFMAVKGLQLSSIGVNLIINTLEDQLVRVLYLEEKFSFRTLNEAVFNHVQTKKFTLFFGTKESDTEVRPITSQSDLEAIKEAGPNWSDCYFKAMVKKKSLRKGKIGSADALRSESDFDASSGGLEYEPLHVDADMITSLLARPLYASFLIETMFDHPKQEKLYESILRWSELTHMSNALIEACADRCLAKTTNENTLFRQDCGSSNFLVKSCEVLAGDYRKRVLAPIIKQYVSDSRKSAPERFAFKLITTLVKTIPEMPQNYKNSLLSLTAKTVEKFPSKNCKNVAVTTFLFLRFFCPAVAVPKTVGLDLNEEQELKAVTFAATLQKIVSAFARGRDDAKFRFELGVLYSRLTNSVQNTIEADAVLNNIRKIVTHHDLLSCQATVERNMEMLSSKDKMMVEDFGDDFGELVDYYDDNVEYEDDDDDDEEEDGYNRSRKRTLFGWRKKYKNKDKAGGSQSSMFWKSKKKDSPPTPRSEAMVA